MERSLDVPTGEAVAVRFELAGIGSRFLAVSIDLAIQVAALLAVLFGALGIAGPLAAFVRDQFARPASVLLIVALAVGVFVVFFGYFIVFELAWHGRTPGKRALGIRVVRDGGFPIDVGAAVIRNLVRVVELGLGFYVISAASALLSPENKRLGDLAAGTIVVRDAGNTLILDDVVAGARADAAQRDDGLGRDERALIERFLARRAALEPAARAAIAARIARRARPQLRASFAHLDDESLLEHLGRPQ